MARFLRTFSTALCAMASVWVAGSVPAHAQVPTYLTQWGTYGSGDGQFQLPSGIATDGGGNVYVGDHYNNRIQVFGSNGQFLRQWGSGGTGLGQFSFIWGVSTDAAGDVFVSDPGNQRVQKFTTGGLYVSQWGSPGFDPRGIACDALGNVWVADAVHAVVAEYDHNGAFVAGIYYPGGSDQTWVPIDVAVDEAGDVFVADGGNFAHIWKFSSSWSLLRRWGSNGTGDGQFADLSDITLDGSGKVYAIDGEGDRGQVFDGNGNFLAKWGAPGSGNAQFSNPSGIATDTGGNIFVSDTANNRVQKFGPLPTPTVATSWGRLKRMYR